jgi:hypothetical protein
MKFREQTHSCPAIGFYPKGSGVPNRESSARIDILVLLLPSSLVMCHMYCFTVCIDILVIMLPSNRVGPHVGGYFY